MQTIESEPLASPDIIIPELHTHKLNYMTSHGISIESLKRNGHFIKVMHLRFGQHKTQGYFALVPTFLRKEFTFSSYGGRTSLFIRAKNGKRIILNVSVKHGERFSYKAGVMWALEKLLPEDIELLKEEI